MTEDNNSRYRSSDAIARAPLSPAPAGDPLAELARLIGQNDPFSSAQKREQHHPAADRDPGPLHFDDAAQRYRNAPAPRYLGDDQPQHADWNDAAVPAHSYPAVDSPPTAQDYDALIQAGPRAQQGLGNYPPDQPGLHPAGSHPMYMREPETGSMPLPHNDEFYDDASRGNRRRGLLTVAAVLMLAVIGTAGAFGYRSFFGRASSSPPVIRASVEPSKVAPPASNADQNASKFNFDRFGDRGKDEQVVAREEKPVDTRDIARANVPGSVFPPVPPANSALARPANAAAVAAPNPPSAIGEPRRVRTVPIRPDQQDIIANSPVAVEPIVTTPARQANAAAVVPVNRPVEVAPPPRQPATPVAARAAASREASPATARPAPPPASAPVANAPLSLSPSSAKNTPPRAAPAPTRLASAPASGGGRYHVQVSSQRSEADAQAAYRGIQAKYPAVLGSRPHVVQRADLGSKGVYYRAMVGPFGSREEALQLCTSLKSAGGDCIVQSN